MIMVVPLQSRSQANAYPTASAKKPIPITSMKMSNIS
jgi:hypothetical protein